MTNLLKLALPLVLVLGAAQSVAAQAACPAADRLTFLKWGGGTPVTPASLASAPHTIYLGTTTYLGSTFSMAIITNETTNTCGQYLLSYDGTTSVTKLTRTSNLCMGGYDDTVEVVHTNNANVPNCGGSTSLNPFLYNGFRLNTYAGAGHDDVQAGLGQDYVYGSSGNDTVIDYGGTFDRIYGELGLDNLTCSAGSISLCNGGVDADYIEDLSGSGDTIQGSAGSDDIRACGNVGSVDCDIGLSDEAWVVVGSTSTYGCEIVHNNPDC